MRGLLRVLSAPARRDGAPATSDQPTLKMADAVVPAAGAAAGRRGAPRLCGAALLGAGLALCAIGSASAGSARCPHPGTVPNSEIYNSANGLETFPGTNVGAIGVGNVCQIGIAISNPPPGVTRRIGTSLWRET
jgi:hypothetical protein